MMEFAPHSFVEISVWLLASGAFASLRCFLGKGTAVERKVLRSKQEAKLDDIRRADKWDGSCSVIGCKQISPALGQFSIEEIL
jgi:hypothetical protein